MQQNKIYKLYLTIGNSILISILLLGCNFPIVEKDHKMDFLYFNNSGLDIKLKSFIISKDSIFEFEHFIKKNNVYIQEGYFESFNEKSISNSDSTIIIFNDSVSTIYNKNTDSKFNILKLENYTKLIISKNKIEYSYTFTGEDFKK